MEGVNVEKSQFYNNFSEFKPISHRDYLALAYGNQKNNVQTDSYDKKKAQKKKKIFKASIIGTSLLALTAFAANIALHKSKVNLAQLAKKGSNRIKELKLGEKIGIGWCNGINVKDDIWDRFSDKVEHTPLFFIKKFNNVTTKFYDSTLKTALKPRYEKAVEALKKAGYEGEIPGEKFDSWYDSTALSMKKTLKENRITKGLFKKETFVKKMTESNIADDTISDILKGQTIEVPKNASKELRSAIEEFNNVKGTLLPKIRDIKCGSAPTDFLTMIVSALGLGVATLTSETKEEKKSTAINYGIPLLTTLAGNMYSTMRAMSGMYGMIFGLVTGQIASIGAKMLDKHLSGNNKTKDAQK